MSTEEAGSARVNIMVISRELHDDGKFLKVLQEFQRMLY
jgi:hypothetical protein